MYITPDGNVFQIDCIEIDDGTKIYDAKIILDDEFLVVKDSNGRRHWYTRSHVVALHGVKQLDTWSWDR